MKKETIITAAVFLGVGFLAGYVYNAQRNAASTEAAASVQRLQEAVRPGGGSRDGVRGADTTPASADATQPDSPTTSTAAPSGEPSSTGLPPGHPAIDAAARIRFLEEKAAKQPNDPKLRLQLANFFYDQKQFGQAIDWYERALELDSRNVNARTDLGTCYFNLGRPREAIREYGRSLALEPGHQPTLFNLIIANLEGTHDLAAAQAAWDRLHRLNPNYPGIEQLKQGLENAQK